MPRLSRAQLEKAITEAMKSKAPQLYEELEESGELEEMVMSRADQAEEDYQFASSAVMTELFNKYAKNPEMPHLERIQEETMALNAAWLETLEQACEFQEETDEEEDVDEEMILQMLGNWENEREMDV